MILQLALQILDINQYNFYDLVKDGTVVEFYSLQCENCKKFIPIYEKIEKQYKDQLTFYRIDCLQYDVLCSNERAKYMPTLILYLGNNDSYRYAESPMTEKDISQWIDNIFIEGWQVRPLSYWNEYLKTHQYNSYFLVDQQVFDPKLIKQLTPKYSTEQFMYHIFLVDHIEPQIQSIRDNVITLPPTVDITGTTGDITGTTEQTPISTPHISEGTLPTFSTFTQWAKDLTLGYFPQLTEQNYKLIRQKDQIYVIGSFSNGKNYFNESINDFIKQNPNKFQDFQQIQFASVDYEENRFFIQSFIDIYDDFNILQGTTMYFLFINHFEQNNFYYQKIEVKNDLNDEIEVKLINFAYKMINEGRTGESTFIKELKLWYQNNPQNDESDEEMNQRMPIQPQYKHFEGDDDE